MIILNYGSLTPSVSAHPAGWTGSCSRWWCLTVPGWWAAGRFGILAAGSSWSEGTPPGSPAPAASDSCRSDRSLSTGTPASPPPDRGCKLQEKWVNTAKCTFNLNDSMKSNILCFSLSVTLFVLHYSFVFFRCCLCDFILKSTVNQSCDWQWGVVTHSSPGSCGGWWGCWTESCRAFWVTIAMTAASCPLTWDMRRGRNKTLLWTEGLSTIFHSNPETKCFTSA